MTRRKSRKLSNEEKADAAAARAQLAQAKGKRSRKGSNRSNRSRKGEGKAVDLRKNSKNKGKKIQMTQTSKRPSQEKKKGKYKVDRSKPGLAPPTSFEHPSARASARSRSHPEQYKDSHRPSGSAGSTRRSSGSDNWRSPRRSRKKSRGDTPERSVELPPLSEVTRDPEEPVLFVGNIPHDVNRGDIIRTFVKYCADEKIRACKMPTQFMKHLGMRHHRGFCFIVLKSQQDLACILDMYKTDGIFVDGYEDTPLTCKFANQAEDAPKLEARRRAEARKKSNEDQLFFGALPWAANEQDIREFAEKHGEIEQLFMPRWPTDPKTGLQKHKGYCFVRFSPDTFQKAKELASIKEHFLDRFPNIPIKINNAKETEPYPKTPAAIREQMAMMYNPFFHPAAHLFPSAMPLDVYRRIFGNKAAPQMVFPTPEEMAAMRRVMRASTGSADKAPAISTY